jgi:hypothetical protein
LPVRAMRLVLILAFFLLPMRAALAQFDHSHAAWSALLAKHVVLIDGGKASQVRYAGFAQDRAALERYLDTLSRVAPGEFATWTKPQQMAFLINAYNAFTIEKVLTRYPDIKSIRDFGRVFGNPFKDRFFLLLGAPSSLDRVEHELLRAKGVYDEPRVHFAVNCASIGCPMLREEAYVAVRLDAQLEAQTVRFLSDRSRNRYDPARNALEVSKIFDWFEEDWQSGYRGIGRDAVPITSREQFLAKYADALAATAEGREAVRGRKVPLAFLEYDWALNDVRR